MGHAHIEHHHNRCTCAHEQGRFSNGFFRSAPGARHISASSAFPLVCAAHAKDCSTECMRVHCQTGRQLHARTHLRARCRRPTPQKLKSPPNRSRRQITTFGLVWLADYQLPAQDSPRRCCGHAHPAAYARIIACTTPQRPLVRMSSVRRGQRWLLSGTRAWLRLNNNDFVGATN